jgi:hypothetical protein
VTSTAAYVTQGNSQIVQTLPALTKTVLRATKGFSGDGGVLIERESAIPVDLFASGSNGHCP